MSVVVGVVVFVTFGVAVAFAGAVVFFGASVSFDGFGVAVFVGFGVAVFVGFVVAYEFDDDEESDDTEISDHFPLL